MYANEHYFNKSVHFLNPQKVKIADNNMNINILAILAYHLANRQLSKQVFLMFKKKT